MCRHYNRWLWASIENIHNSGICFTIDISLTCSNQEINIAVTVQIATTADSNTRLVTIHSTHNLQSSCSTRFEGR